MPSSVRDITTVLFRAAQPKYVREFDAALRLVQLGDSSVEPRAAPPVFEPGAAAEVPQSNKAATPGSPARASRAAEMDALEIANASKTRDKPRKPPHQKALLARPDQLWPQQFHEELPIRDVLQKIKSEDVAVRFGAFCDRYSSTYGPESEPGEVAASYLRHLGEGYFYAPIVAVLALRVVVKQYRGARRLQWNWGTAVFFSLALASLSSISDQLAMSSFGLDLASDPLRGVILEGSQFEAVADDICDDFEQNDKATPFSFGFGPLLMSICQQLNVGSGKCVIAGTLAHVEKQLGSSETKIDLMLLLCCNLLSLAEGGSTTVVAWGVHLPSGCHCCVIVCHHTPHIRHRNGRMNTQKSETIAEVRGNSAYLCRVFWARSFRLLSGSTHISRFKHRCAAPPCVLRFWCFLLSRLSGKAVQGKVGFVMRPAPQ